MAVTLNELGSMFGVEGVSYFRSPNDDTLLIPYVHANQVLVVMVEVKVDGGYVRWHIPYFMHLPESGEREAMLTCLMERNRALKLLKFCLDPLDGEISVEVGLPIQDGTITKSQVSRCLYLMMNIAAKERDGLFELTRTGKYPVSESVTIDESIARLFANSENADADDESEDDDFEDADCGSDSPDDGDTYDE